MATSVKAPLLWSTASSVGAQLISFVTFAVLARTLGSETFGLVALAVSIIELLLVLSSAGIADAVVQRKELDEDDAATAFWVNMALGGFFLALTLACAEPIANFYNRPDLQAVVQALSLVFLLTPLGAIHNARLVRAMSFRVLAIRNVIANVIGAAVGITLALRGFGAWALVGQRLVMAATLALLAWTATRWLPRMALKKSVLVSLLRFGGYLSLSQVFILLNGRIAELLSGIYMGPGTVAFIRAGGRVIDVLNQLTFAPFHTISMPLQARIQDDPQQFAKLYIQLSRVSGIIMFPTFLGVFALAPPVVAIVFGPGWDQTADAIRILALMVFPLQFNILLLSALTASGRSRLVLLWSMTQAMLGVALVVFAAPYGWQAMLSVNVLRAYLLLPFALSLQGSVLGVSWREVLRGIRPPATSALAMAALVFLLNSLMDPLLPAPVRLMLLVPLGALAFLGLYLVQDRSGIALFRQLWMARQRRDTVPPAV